MKTQLPLRLIALSATSSLLLACATPDGYLSSLTSTSELPHTLVSQTATEMVVVIDANYKGENNSDLDFSNWSGSGQSYYPDASRYRGIPVDRIDTPSQRRDVPDIAEPNDLADQQPREVDDKPAKKKRLARPNQR